MAPRLPECEPVAPTGIPAATSAAPELAHDGDGYGLLFGEPSDAGDIRAWWFIALDANGFRRGEPVVVAPGGALDGRSLAFTGDAFVAALVTNGDDGPGIYSFRLDPSGEALEPPRQLARGPQPFDLVWTGRDLAFVRSDGSATRFRRLSPVGEPRGPEVTVAEASDGVALSWGGDGFALALGPDHRPSHVRLAPDGSPVGDRTVVCCTTSDGWISGGPAAVAYLGGSSLVWADVTSSRRPLSLTRFDARGTPMETSAISDAAWTRHAVIAGNEDELGVAWMASDDDGSGIYFRRIEPRDASASAVLELRRGHESTGAGEVDRMSIVRSRSGYAIAWTELHRDGVPRVAFAHVCAGE